MPVPVHFLTQVPPCAAVTSEVHSAVPLLIPSLPYTVTLRAKDTHISLPLFYISLAVPQWSSHTLCLPFISSTTIAGASSVCQELSFPGDSEMRKTVCVLTGLTFRIGGGGEQTLHINLTPHLQKPSSSPQSIIISKSALAVARNLELQPPSGRVTSSLAPLALVF